MTVAWLSFVQGTMNIANANTEGADWQAISLQLYGCRGPFEPHMVGPVHLKRAGSVAAILTGSSKGKVTLESDHPLWPFFTSVKTAGIHWLVDAVYAAICFVPTNAMSRSNCTAIWYVVCLRSGLDGPPQLYSWNGSCNNHNLWTAKLLAFPLSH